jgi:hypothetical protein
VRLCHAECQCSRLEIVKPAGMDPESPATGKLGRGGWPQCQSTPGCWPPCGAGASARYYYWHWTHMIGVCAGALATVTDWGGGAALIPPPAAGGGPPAAWRRQRARGHRPAKSNRDATDSRSESFQSCIADSDELPGKKPQRKLVARG